MSTVSRSMSRRIVLVAAACLVAALATAAPAGAAWRSLNGLFVDQDTLRACPDHLEISLGGFWSGDPPAPATYDAGLEATTTADGAIATNVVLNVPLNAANTEIDTFIDGDDPNDPNNIFQSTPQYLSTSPFSVPWSPDQAVGTTVTIQLFNPFPTETHDPFDVVVESCEPVNEPPDTTITSNLPNPSGSSSASFTFTGTDDATAPGDLTFECELDGGGFTACTSPQSYSSLSDESHTFQVRATDEAGNTDGTPASFTWEIDTSVPTPTCNGLPATIVAQPGQASIKGTNTDDVIVATSGPIEIHARDGNDVICTGAGSDRVFGDDGDDWIDAGDGSNYVKGGDDDDTVRAGAGNDHVKAGSGDDTVDAGNGNNRVQGEKGADSITTGSGNDEIDGGKDVDTCAPGGGMNKVKNCEL